MDERIVGEKIDIKYENTLDFFNSRGAEKPLKHKYNYVLFQDDNPELAIERDRQEKEKIGQLIEWEKDEKVLDIGCGVGRWGEDILKRGLFYTGIDYSEQLLKIAKENLKEYGESYTLIHEPFQNFIKGLKDIHQFQGFDKIFINGVLMYLNDEDLKKGLDDVCKVLGEHCTIYIKETVAKTDRLTLNQFYSNDLKHDYTAIYRYMGEYQQLFEEKFIKQCNFKMAHTGDLFSEDLKNRAETKDYYYILKR